MAVSQGGFVTISFQAGAEPVTIRRRLASWNADIADMSPAWTQVGNSLLNDFATNFAQEGGFFGRFSRWPQLAPATVKDRLRKGYGGAHPILMRTGELFFDTTVRGAGGNIFQVGTNSLVVGTSNRYAVYHQNGTNQHRLYHKVKGSKGLHDFLDAGRNATGVGGIPPRPIVGVSWKARSRIVDILNQYVTAQARAAQIAIQQGGSQS